ncbi:MAG TPA: glycosyltransferase, partial [Myxococcaceae bacterium]
MLIATFGTRGDTQPMLALSEALVARGHDVSLAVAPSSLQQARELVPSAFGVGMGYEEISRRASSGKLRDVFSTIPLVREDIRVQLEMLEGPAAEADVIVGASV